MNRLVNAALALLAFAAIATAWLQLAGTTQGLDIRPATIGTTPATVFRPVGAPPGPVVVIAHGFAGSQQLMRPFAITFARNGLTAITFDVLGHGRNPAPLSGSITEIEGATTNLVAETRRVVAYARTMGDGRVAILGHSMASDIVVRTAEAEPSIAATIAVSMFSPAVTATEPKNLLVVVGAGEPGLTDEALRAVGLPQSAPAEPGVTYGRFEDGTARRAAIAPGVEHISVLYSRTAMQEAQAWLDRVFSRPASTYADQRGPWILLLLAGIVLLIRPIAAVLPAAAPAPTGAGIGWRGLARPLLAATILTPLILWVVPTHFLPVLVGDYLAVHFLTFGLILCAGTGWTARHTPRASTRWPGLLLAAAILTLAITGGLAVVFDTQVTSFIPAPNRLPLMAALLCGTLPFFLALEWSTGGPRHPRLGFAAAEFGFLLSLAIAIALDFQGLFFLAIIVPVVLVFFLITALFSRWSYAATHHPAVAAIANATLFAWAIGVTFPLLAH